MSSLRCTCGVRWPFVHDDYGKCPECGKRTWYSTDEPITEDEARSRKSHADFDRLYADHEAAAWERQLDEIRNLAASASDLPETIESD